MRSGQALVSAGEDGSVFLLALTINDMLADEQEHGKMADLVLVYRSDFQKQDEKIEMLTGDLTTLQGALSSQVPAPRVHSACAIHVSAWSVGPDPRQLEQLELLSAAWTADVSQWSLWERLGRLRTARCLSSARAP